MVVRVPANVSATDSATALWPDNRIATATLPRTGTNSLACMCDISVSVTHKPSSHTVHELAAVSPGQPPG